MLLFGKRLDELKPFGVLFAMVGSLISAERVQPVNIRGGEGKPYHKLTFIDLSGKNYVNMLFFDAISGDFPDRNDVVATYGFYNQKYRSLVMQGCLDLAAAGNGVKKLVQNPYDPGNSAASVCTIINGGQYGGVLDLDNGIDADEGENNCDRNHDMNDDQSDVIDGEGPF